MDLPKKSYLFVIQKHHAKNLHYDFRLSNGKVLKSWAVPKNLSKTTGIKRLGIEVDDHKLSYAHFEGEIPEGQYGAGKVEIFDIGEYYNLSKGEKGEPLKLSASLKKGHVDIYLEGKIFKGHYAIIRMKPKQWLIIKMKRT